MLDLADNEAKVVVDASNALTSLANKWPSNDQKVMPALSHHLYEHLRAPIKLFVDDVKRMHPGDPLCQWTPLPNR